MKKTTIMALIIFALMSKNQFMSMDVNAISQVDTVSQTDTINLASNNARVSGGPITVKKISKNVVRVTVQNISSDVLTVQFPTWTDVNGQDDLVWYGKTKTSSTMYYDIDISNHKNGKDLYHTHVYGVDSTGKQTGIGAISYTFNPSLTLSASTTSWTNGNVIITAKASDISGTTKITLPNGNVVTTGSTTYTVSANGTYTFKVDDGFGNVVTKSITVSNIDKSINNISNVNGTMSRTNDTTRTFKATFNTVTDSQSGLKGYSYVIDKNTSTTPDNTVDITTNQLTRTFSESETGVYYLHIKAIDNAGNVSSVVHHKIDIPTLTTTAKPTSNLIRLDWTLNDYSNKTYKVFQKKEGSSSYQSVSMVDFTNVKEVKVLNVYPNVGNNLKTWMETEGFGKGIIKVTPVSIDNFNNNPDSYLKNSDGSYKYDVVMFGSWDVNNSKDLNETSSNAMKNFINSGRGVLFGHDTIYYGNTYFKQLMSYANIATSANSTYNGVASLNGFGTPPATGNSNITIVKKGLLTNYPWSIGDVGTVLTVPSTHNTQLSNGDIWMRFNCPNYTSADMLSTSNFYLSTWNNTAYIQTGHSKGNATSDEKKLLANTLFYLKQLSTDNYLNDNSGQDIKAPNKISTINSVTYSNNKINFNFTAPTDNGSTYSYYVESTDKNNNITLSPIKTQTIVSGIRGYSYVIDSNANTEPDNIIDSTSNSISANNITGTNNTYIHIKAIDYTGNVGATLHYKVVDSVAPTLTLTPSTTAWTNGSVTITAKAIDNETGVKSITLPNGNVVNGSTASYSVSANGTYTFKATDYYGNVTTKTITVSNIDKTINSISIVQNISTWTNKDVILSVSATDTQSGIKSITLPNGTVFNGSSTTFTVTTNGTYTFKFTDNAGNVATQTVNISKIDKTAPTINITGNPTNWTNGTATLTVTASDSLSGIKSITLPDGTIVNSSSAKFSVSANGTYTFKTTDNAGNVTTQTVNVSKIDKTMPTINITGNPTNWSNNIGLTITGSDSLSGVKSITLPNGSVVNGSSTTYSVSSNGTYTFKVTDNAGNVTTQSVSVTKLDNTAPTLTINKSTSAWINGTVELTITATDSQSGVNKIQLPNGNYVTGSTTKYIVSANGTYTFKSVDNAGNIGTNSITISNIDTSSPTVTNTVTYKDNNSKATITINATDSHSGVYSIKDFRGNTVLNNTLSIDVTSNGMYLFEVMDNAGNKAIHSVSVTNIKNSNSSGISRIEYKLSGATTQDWTTYTSAFYITNEGTTTITARSYDNAGNISSEATSTVKLDKTKPINGGIKIELN